MTIERVGIIGAGTMGAGIATNIAENGFGVRLVDISQETLDGAVKRAGAFYGRNVEKERMGQDEADAALERLSTSTNLNALADCDLVIEAVFERFDIKAEVYSKVNDILKEDVILGTNTSCLKVSALAESVRNPERFLGIHYFNPPAVNPIVEVVRGEKTLPSIVAAVVSFCEDSGKKPVQCRDSSGFALNRFFCPYANEAARLFDDGLGTAAEIDRVANDVLGAAAGPFVVMNLVGMQVMMHAQDNLTELGAFYTPARSVKEKGKVGAVWTIDPLETEPDESRDKILADRLLGATFLPILQELEEEVATPADIDLGASLALKFGKPPCALMDALGKDEVDRVVSLLTQQYGVPVPATIANVGSLTA
ncbi:MAG: 3-hydroxyacyl-CoA dehydrogenase NAD-binding domain-containing protein [Proteobacteria bacterium]|nr:3-hydroxyacyl-CoA dehydrogenase NAD-binding domain-containing protein [Pseudomonadota bacterium]